MRITKFTFALMIGMIVLLAVALKNSVEHPPLAGLPATPQLQSVPTYYNSPELSFNAFGYEYDSRKTQRKLDQMNEEWKGRTVTWQGRVTNLNPTGKGFTIVPKDPDHRVECDIFVSSEAVIVGVNLGMDARVVAKIEDVNVLGVIVRPE